MRFKENKIFKVLNVGVNAMNEREIISKTDQLILENIKGYITVTGVHGIMESLNSEKVKKAHLSSFLTIPDGMPLVWIGKLKGYRNISRCYGPDVMLSMMEHSVEKGYTHFFYGGAPGVAEKLKATMENKYPGIKILGTYCPPFRPLNKNEEKELINMIESLTPDFFWVGLSTPKQELFMYDYINMFDTKIMLGVGAAFDFHTGRVKQAPNWVQKIGMEWVFRTLMEPKRLWKRYFRNNPLFIYYFILQLLGFKKFK